MRRFTIIVGTLCAAVCLVAAAPTWAGTRGASERHGLPTVTGPISGGQHGFAYNAFPWSLKQFGYRQDEYFISGVARAFGAAKPPAAYRVAFQVQRPIDPKRFNGVVVVEWDNVTAQTDEPIDWFWAHPWAMRQGVVWVSATVQQVGVCGAGAPASSGVSVVVPICTPLSLKGWDPQRYGSLHHPGDDYAYDIFSQIGQSMRHRRGVDPLGGLHVRHTIAIGESQSAQKLDDYLCNGADTAAKVFDGVVIDADFTYKLGCRPRPRYIRLWSEDSMVPDQPLAPPRGRVWEVVGASHTDAWIEQMVAATALHNETGEPPSQSYQQTAAAAGAYGQAGVSDLPEHGACVPSNNEFPRRYAVDAALQALTTWVTKGQPPPVAPAAKFTSNSRMELATDGDLVRDQDGNAVGGLRLPVMTVPVATYYGATCELLGRTEPFTPVRLAQLYPSHAAYVGKMYAATQHAVRAGYLLPADAADLMRRACASTVGGSSTGRCPRITARSPYAGR